MDSQRAQEISSSSVMGTVTYNGNQIYIEHVDQQKGIATIHPLDDPNKKETVSVTDLIEQ